VRWWHRGWRRGRLAASNARSLDAKLRPRVPRVETITCCVRRGRARRATMEIDEGICRRRAVGRWRRRRQRHCERIWDRPTDVSAAEAREHRVRDTKARVCCARGGGGRARRRVALRRATREPRGRGCGFLSSRRALAVHGRCAAQEDGRDARGDAPDHGWDGRRRRRRGRGVGRGGEARARKKVCRARRERRIEGAAATRDCGDVVRAARGGKSHRDGGERERAGTAAAAAAAAAAALTHASERGARGCASPLAAARRAPAGGGRDHAARRRPRVEDSTIGSALHPDHGKQRGRGGARGGGIEQRRQIRNCGGR
jgi:hypothetical protein